MPQSRLIRFSTCLAALFSLTYCTSETSNSVICNPGDPGCSATGGSNSSGWTSQGSATGGKASVGGAISVGGTSSKGGTMSTGGVTSAGGTTSTGGTMAATGGVRVDAKGVPLASSGDKKTLPSEYLNLGDIRLLNNRWGSDELNCGTTMSVYVNPDKTLGWDFNRPTCGGDAAKPDYPEVEFGVHPFGSGNVLETSPPFSSTTLLPRQIKDITSASVTVDSLSISLTSPTSWNLNVEFWLSQRHPTTDSNPGVYAEVIAFWGWQNGRWPCETTLSATVNSGDKSYKLCHQSDSWGSSATKWKYYQFNVNGGPLQNYTGKADIKAFLDWVVSAYGASKDLWLTRIEVGSEIDDNTSGKVTLKNITFEVNGTSKSVELAK